MGHPDNNIPFSCEPVYLASMLRALGHLYGFHFDLEQFDPLFLRCALLRQFFYLRVSLFDDSPEFFLLALHLLLQLFDLALHRRDLRRQLFLLL